MKRRSRKGTPEQVAKFDRACRELWAYKTRTEDETYHQLNGRVNDLAPPLSRWQQSVWATSSRLDRADSRDRRDRRRGRSR